MLFGRPHWELVSAQISSVGHLYDVVKQIKPHGVLCNCSETPAPLSSFFIT